MIRPLGTDRRTKRKRELRDVLDTKASRGSRRKTRFPALGKLRAYVIAHYKMILSVAVIVAFVYTHIYYFNKLTSMHQQVGNLRSQVSAGLQMRENTIAPVAVALNTIMDRERSLMMEAVSARKESLESPAASLNKLREAMRQLANNELSLTQLHALAENYPQLASVQAYQVFITQIREVEDEIWRKRNEYNDAVNQYNTSLSVFPANLVGSILGFDREPYFAWDKGQEWTFQTDGESGERRIEMKPAKKDQGE